MDFLQESLLHRSHAVEGSFTQLLTVNRDKMVMGTHKIEFLGHIFENGKVLLNPERTKLLKMLKCKLKT